MLCRFCLVSAPEFYPNEVSFDRDDPVWSLSLVLALSLDLRVLPYVIIRCAVQVVSSCFLDA